MPRPVFRFAPSPTGYLHIGHALSALTNFAMARAAGGRHLLRIEDVDTTRCRPEFEQAIYQDLAWLGIEWEEPVRRQSDHLAEYAATLAALEGKGLVYPAFESRAEIARIVAEKEKAGIAWPRDPDGTPLYPRTARALSPEEVARRRTNEPFALRLDTRLATQGAGRLTWIETGDGPAREITATPAQWGDVVLGGKERVASYHLAVVLDDALQGVTHVVRGRDLYQATSVHRLLQELLGLEPPIYHHHRLILDEAGQKLSKRDRSTTLRELRAAGWTPADVRRAVGI
jgi:glutamyl-Q tRNA(Asp) synthetase